MLFCLLLFFFIFFLLLPYSCAPLLPRLIGVADAIAGARYTGAQAIFSHSGSPASLKSNKKERREQPASPVI
jgi:hypothetical protein